MAAGRNNSTLWLMLTVCSSMVSLTLAHGDCQPWYDWSREFCCKDKELGCFDKYSPYTDFPMPCCFNDYESTFALYTQGNIEPVFLHRENPVPSTFSSTKRTVFISHGWFGDDNNDHYVAMKDNFLTREDCNVVMLDWPSHRANYPKSASETRTVGMLTSLIMKKLVEEGGASYDNIWCVGHSLGSHVCSAAGRNTPEKIGRITALDPAGPWFEGEEDLSVGLNPNDAMLVDVIHTDDSGIVTHYGTLRPLGHIDFYVNGGDLHQPGCLDKKKRMSRRKRIACSHSRSVALFNESILKDCFISRAKCTDYKNLPDSCSVCEGDGVCAVMGYAVQGEDGIYDVDTNASSPYCVS